LTSQGKSIVMQKGQIRVQTENIFPIIKKFLYSDHEIFLRELVSNATDATQKIKTLSSIGEAKGELGELRIDVRLDAKEKTITIQDRGVGMSKEEVDKYLNQVAFSGAEEFLTKYKDASIIGHFGLGFYSAFMVASKVEVLTQSYQEDAATVYWSCDGSPEFELYEVEKKQRGTKIILHVNEESAEFLDAFKLKGILEKFCKFLPIPIFFTDVNAEVKKEEEKEEEKSINNTNPIWVKKPSELTKEDYEKFYRELYPFGETPLFWIHLNVDYPFNLTGVLYFPKIKQSYEIQKDKIQLYCNQVFVTDEVKDIVPEFLMLMTDDKFLDKANKFLVMENVDGKFFTLDEYKTATESLQKNKEGKHIVLYTTNPVQQDAYIQACKLKGYEVVKMETLVDAAFLNTMEMKWENTSFVRVDADIVDNLIDKQESTESVLSKEETEQLKTLFTLQIPELHVTTEVKGLSTDSAPVIATRPEFMRRMKDMGAAGGGMTAFYAQMPDEVTLTVNGNHPVFQNILKENNEDIKTKQVRNLADLALLSQGLLKGAELTNFINRSVQMMQGVGQ
jgi:molecular chaperone HtpG